MEVYCWTWAPFKMGVLIHKSTTLLHVRFGRWLCQTRQRLVCCSANTSRLYHIVTEGWYHRVACRSYAGEVVGLNSLIVNQKKKQ